MEEQSRVRAWDQGVFPGTNEKENEIEQMKWNEKYQEIL